MVVGFIVGVNIFLVLFVNHFRGYIFIPGFLSGVI